MPTQRDPAAAMGSQGKAEDAKAKAQTAAQEAEKANETLQNARLRLQEAQQTLDRSNSALRNAVDAQIGATKAVSESQQKQKLAAKEAENAAQSKAKIDIEVEKVSARLRDQEDKAAKAESRGKQPNQGALEKAKNELAVASEKAESALLESNKGRQASEASQKELEAAEARLQNAEEELVEAKDALALAKAELSEAENNLKMATKEADTALKNQDKANKDAEKAMRKYEADLAKMEAKAVAEESVQQYSAPVVIDPDEPKAGQLEPEILEEQAPSVREEPEAATLREVAQVADTYEDQRSNAETVPAEAPDGELFGGMVTLFITGPVGYAQIKRLGDSLGQFDSLRVRSLGGRAGDGSQITIAIGEPTPLLVRLHQLDNVARVSKTGKGIEVTLKT